MATKTKTASETTAEVSTAAPRSTPSMPGDIAFLKKAFPHEAGDKVEPRHIDGRSYRVNVRRADKKKAGDIELTLWPIVASKFVYVESLADGSPTLRYAPRQ